MASTKPLSDRHFFPDIPPGAATVSIRIKHMKAPNLRMIPSASERPDLDSIELLSTILQSAIEQGGAVDYLVVYSVAEDPTHRKYHYAANVTDDGRFPFLGHVHLLAHRLARAIDEDTDLVEEGPLP
jgi:hypothetical protein